MSGDSIDLPCIFVRKLLAFAVLLVVFPMESIVLGQQGKKHEQGKEYVDAAVELLGSFQPSDVTFEWETTDEFMGLLLPRESMSGRVLLDPENELAVAVTLEKSTSADDALEGNLENYKVRGAGIFVTGRDYRTLELSSGLSRISREESFQEALRTSSFPDLSMIASGWFPSSVFNAPQWRETLRTIFSNEASVQVAPSNGNVTVTARYQLRDAVDIRRWKYSLTDFTLKSFTDSRGMTDFPVKPVLDQVYEWEMSDNGQPRPLSCTSTATIRRHVNEDGVDKFVTVLRRTVVKFDWQKILPKERDSIWSSANPKNLRTLPQMESFLSRDKVVAIVEE